MMSPIFRKPFSQVVCIRNATMLLFAIAPSLAYAKQQPYTIGEFIGLLAVFAILIGPFAYLSWIGEKEEKEAAERRVRELEAERGVGGMTRLGGTGWVIGLQHPCLLNGTQGS